MPDWLWESANIIVFINLPKNQLKKNISRRFHNAKENKDFSHWQSKRYNNYKNYFRIALIDNSLKKNVDRISKMVKDKEIVILKSMREVNTFIDNLNNRL